MKTFVCVSGNVGSGKTEATKTLADALGFKMHAEPFEKNPFLPLFYQDMKKWAYRSQQFYLLSKFLAHQQMKLNEGEVIQDRSFYEDMEIFAELLIRKGFFTHEQAEQYRSFARMIQTELRHPDILIYLKASVPVLKQRVQQRGHDYEKELAEPDNTYLQELQELYDQWIQQYQGNKLIIETDNIDLVSNEQHKQELIQKVREALKSPKEKQ